MEGNKVFLTKLLVDDEDYEVQSSVESERIRHFLGQDDVLAIVIVNADVELTIEDVKLFEHLFRRFWRREVTVVY